MFFLAQEWQVKTRLKEVELLSAKQRNQLPSAAVCPLLREIHAPTERVAQRLQLEITLQNPKQRQRIINLETVKQYKLRMTLEDTHQHLVDAFTLATTIITKVSAQTSTKN